jgi:hypothetical protein
MTLYLHATIGRRRFRVVKTDDAIFITTDNRHGPSRSVDPDSELGQKILAVAS